MKRAAFAIPGHLDTPTGGYAYDKRIIDELCILGWQIQAIDLGSSFPHPDDAAREVALGRLLTIPEGQLIVIDGLAFGAMAQEARKLCDRNPLAALVHHPLALETGLDTATAQILRDSERAALGCARAVIVTSKPTAEILLRDYGVSSDRLTVIRPGVDVPARQSRPRDDRGFVDLLAVGSITPRKGYDILLAALAGLQDLPWRLTIVGDTARDAAAVARLQADMARLQQQDRVVIAGAMTQGRLTELYAGADVFVLASLFEGYGMVFGEALAHGLPIVATAVGAGREIVPRDAGVLVAPGDTNSLSDALRHVIGSADARTRMASAALVAARRLPRWRQSAEDFARVLEALV